MLRLEIDGHYASHLIVTRSGPADYQVLLGRLAAGHHRVNVDTAVNRRFAIGSQRAIEVRWEVFNVFNADQFGLPDSNISNSTRGTITRLAGDPRVMQFAFRLVF